MMTTAGFIVRIMFAVLLVFGIYNPSGYSYYDWLVGDQGHWTVKLFGASVLAFLLFIHAQATWRSMKLIGILLVLSVVSSFGWVLWDFGVIDLADPTTRSLGLLSTVAIVLGAGQSWSLVRYRLSGQVDSQNLIA